MALHHRVLPPPHSQPGSWRVGHAVPGMPGCWSVDGDALTRESAEALAAHLNGQQAVATERECERFIASILADQPMALVAAH